jgi:cobalt-zinc-cadmium resistance protein CzcA
LPQITIKYDYNKTLYGLNIKDINQIIRASFAGESAGKIYEEKTFDVVVRMSATNRSLILQMFQSFFPLPNGQQVP